MIGICPSIICCKDLISVSVDDVTAPFCGDIVGGACQCEYDRLVADSLIRRGRFGALALTMDIRFFIRNCSERRCFHCIDELPVVCFVGTICVGVSMGDGSVTVVTYAGDTVFINNFHIPVTVVFQCGSSRFHSIDGTRYFLTSFTWQCNLWITDGVGEGPVLRVTCTVGEGINVGHCSTTCYRSSVGLQCVIAADVLAAGISYGRHTSSHRMRSHSVGRAVHR